MTSSFVISVLVAGMLLSGSLNTLLLKYQDQQCELASEAKSNGCASFPVLQSFAMFVGESLCFVVIGLLKAYQYYRQTASVHDTTYPASNTNGNYLAINAEDRDEEDTDGLNAVAMSMQTESDKAPLRGVAALYLALPALADICATTTMSVGLLLVPASIFQMCRGSLVLFVGIFSVFFLRRTLLLHQWAALVFVTFGVFIVGLSTVLSPLEPSSIGHEGDNPQTIPDNLLNPGARNAIIGMLMITGAQSLTATQFVIEEWILSRYAIEPLRVAGLEGIFGTFMTTIGILVAYFSYGKTPAGFNGTFDVQSGLSSILGNTQIWPAFLLFAVSIASFNFFGLSVTRSVSATSRSTIDTCRTLLIWTISMVLGWESFRLLQLCGFVILVYATLLFNGVLKPPRFLRSADAEYEINTGREHTFE